ncbi:hypothetical protein POM88_006899 [Heracleum sosnowskyi]|uniref:NAF domain-containing protein n=1 Tax=Heracleum sosnowskyi TaxID=360622 RepID=A0AAD8N5Z3_9APIA|nr:hypothetical protein POM88_006899 [Heracleum sosnowskyi]
MKQCQDVPLRITIADVLKDEWFKKDYKPPVFEDKLETNLDDVEAVFKDSEVQLSLQERPAAMNAFELISMSKGLNLGNLFDVEQSQLVCSGCVNLLLYPVEATSVCCAVCKAVTSVPPPGTEMAQLVCGVCHTLLMYIRGATSVKCSCCHTVNLDTEANQVAHVNCGNCQFLLMYPYGARSVKCAVCHFVTSVGDRMLPDAITESDKTLEGFAQIALKMRLHQLLKTEFGLHLECCGKVVYAEEMILV